MVMAALSPSSVLASPVQVNPQVKTDLQYSAPQVAEDAQKAAKKVQTDTVTISAQALKMADDKNADAKAVYDKVEDQKASATRDNAKRNALKKAYSAVSH